MIGYTPTPDYYNDYIQHGWLKDAAAKTHKYIERWRGKNGKWYYRYKNAISGGLTRLKRNAMGLKHAPFIVTKGRNMYLPTDMDLTTGRPTSMSGRTGAKIINAYHYTPKPPQEHTRPTGEGTRPRSRKKKYISGSASVKRKGKGLGYRDSDSGNQIRNQALYQKWKSGKKPLTDEEAYQNAVNMVHEYERQENVKKKRKHISTLSKQSNNRRR